jgi:hypothetical protein
MADFERRDPASYPADLSAADWQREFRRRRRYKSDLNPQECLEPGMVYWPTPGRPDLKYKIPQGYAAVLFDMAQPIKGQIEEAKEALIFFQKGLLKHKNTDMLPVGARQRKWKHPWLVYLRALDAEAAGASYEEIAQELLPKSKSVNLRRRGQELLESAHCLHDLLCTK